METTKVDATLWHRILPIAPNTIVTYRRGKETREGRIVGQGRIKGIANNEVFYQVEDLDANWRWLYISPRDILKIWSKEEWSKAKVEEVK